MITTRYIRRHYINGAVKNYNPKGSILEIGSGQNWRYYSSSLTFNCDSSAMPDIVGNGEEPCFKDNAFDSVVLIEVLEHTKNPHVLISEIYRILKVNGSLLMTVPFVFEMHDNYDYFRYTDKAIMHLLKDFHSISVFNNGGKWCVICHFFRLGIFGKFFFPILNDFGYFMDSNFSNNQPKITLGYTVTAYK